MYSPQIGIVGGTGLDDPDILEERVEKSVNTPYGKVRNINSTHFLWCEQPLITRDVGGRASYDQNSGIS